MGGDSTEHMACILLIFASPSLIPTITHGLLSTKIELLAQGRSKI